MFAHNKSFGIYEIVFTNALNINWILYDLFCMNEVVIIEIFLFTMLLYYETVVLEVWKLNLE